MAGHEDAEVMTGHIGTNTPKFAPSRFAGDDRPLTLLKQGCAKSGVFGARRGIPHSPDNPYPLIKGVEVHPLN